MVLHCFRRHGGWRCARRQSADSKSRSDLVTVAVDFRPRTVARGAVRRGATLDWSQVLFIENSSVMTRDSSLATGGITDSQSNFIPSKTAESPTYLVMGGEVSIVRTLARRLGLVPEGLRKLAGGKRCPRWRAQTDHAPAGSLESRIHHAGRTSANHRRREELRAQSPLSVALAFGRES
jgi:hypothetical protein